MYLRKSKYDYFGYDLDQKFINIGLDYLVKLKSFNKNKKKIQINNLSFNYKISNIEKDNFRNYESYVNVTGIPVNGLFLQKIK